MPSRFRARAVRPLRLRGLWMLPLASLLAAAVPAQALAKGACTPGTNVPVNATFSPIADADPLTGNTPNGGLFGHTPTAGSVYQNGVSGTVVFLICNGTGDFYLNLSSSEFFTYDFSKGLVQNGSVPFLPAGTRLAGWVINVNKVGNLALYTFDASGIGVLNTQMVSTLYANSPYPNSSYQADYVLYCDQTTVTVDCSGKRQMLADNTSLIQVTTDRNCLSWTITPVPMAVAGGSYAVAGLIDQTSPRGNATLVSGGQYSMPFTITLTRSDGVAGCAGLLQ